MTAAVATRARRAPTATMARRLLRDRLRALRWWALGTLVGVASIVTVYPSVKGQEDLEAIVRDLPSGVRAMLGTDVSIPLTSAVGFLQARLFATLLMILLVVYAIGLGARAIGAAEEDGTLQLVVAGPVTRRRVALERLCASALLVVGLAVLALVATIALAAPVGILEEVSPFRIALATAAVVELALLHLAVAFAAGAVSGRRGPAIAVASAVAVGAYVVHGLAASAELARPLRIVSPFWWFLDRNLLVEDPTFLALGLPAFLAVAASAAGVASYERRDLRFG